MTTVIILAAIAVPCAFAFGWAVGHEVGKTDGYAEAAEDCRRRTAGGGLPEEVRAMKNIEKYKTADEAYRAFIEFCCKYKCKNCRFGDRLKPVGCAFAWLYEEAEKGETK